MPVHHIRVPQRLVSSLFGVVLAFGCVADDSRTSAATGSSTASSNASGSETSAPGSATEPAVGDSAPTQATATMPPDTGGGVSTAEPCRFVCGDMAVDDCDLAAQDCPEGQKCSAYISDGGASWDAAQCVDITGADEVGDKCTLESVTTGRDSCVEGAICWGSDQDGIGVCIAFCTGSEEAFVCPGMSRCTITTGGLLNLCLPDCDPLFEHCQLLEACYPGDGTFVCQPDESGAEGQANDPCVSHSSCDNGLLCADAAFVGAGCPEGSAGCCTPWCAFPKGACPNPDQQCIEWPNPQYPGEDLGACGVPQ